MENQQPVKEPRRGLRFRTRMAISYIVVTLVIVLMLETLVVGAAVYAFTRSPMVGWWMLQQADHAAQIIALQSAVYADEANLSPQTTFDASQTNSHVLQREENQPNLSWFELSVPYIAPGTPPPNRPTYALVIDKNERIVASSYPDRYSPGMQIDQVLPAESELIRGGLSGESNGEVRELAEGTHASVVRTIWNQNREPIGAVYIQAPAYVSPDANLLADVGIIVIPSALIWLVFMLPIGMVFGVLSTRKLIRRIERLADATARFKDGDINSRVPVHQFDEIGQLEQQFNQMAEQLVESFEQRQALAEQSARREERARIEQELHSARYIQESLLPRTAPEIPGWQIQTYYNPARDVGGDFFNFLPLPDGQFGIVIGDATGKGVPSALIMATTSAMLRAATAGEVYPGRVLGLVNDLLHGIIPTGTFATCFYAILDPFSGRLRYANAGHNLPYLARDSEVIELHAVGMPLGILPEQAYEEKEMILHSDDSILFYTDGLVEAHNENREMFGDHRLRQRIQARAISDGLIDSLARDLQAFVGPESEQEDDVTLMLLRKVRTQG